MADQGEIELPDQGDNIIRTIDPDVSINPKGLAHELMVCMKRNKNKTAQIDAETGTSETFEQVLERSIRVGVNLRKHGVKPKDIIMMCSTNHLNTSVVFHATMMVGAIPANMHPFSPVDSMKNQLKLIKPKFVFAVPETVDILDRIIKELGLSTQIVVFGFTEDHVPFKRFLLISEEDERDFSPYEVTDIYDTALILFSSGSTGSPKGICLNHFAFLTKMEVVKGSFKGAFLTFSSMVSFSTTMSVLLTAMSGSIRLLCDDFTPEKAWRYFKEYKPNVFAVPPHDYMALIRSQKPEGLDLSHLLVIQVAGGGISLQNRNEGKKVFPNSIINVPYGQTELVGMGTLNRFTGAGLEMLVRKPMMCGMPTKGSMYKIVDPDTEEILGPNQTGELRIKSIYVMNGYYNMPCHDRFDKDGFLKTGDLLYYDEEHCFFFVERLNETLRYKMYFISPLELENILSDHPSVKTAVVLGKPTDEGDLAFAVVVKNDDGVTAEELEQLVAAKVDDRKRLRAGVVFVKQHELPFTPSGKIKRRVLREYIFNNYVL